MAFAVAFAIFFATSVDALTVHQQAQSHFRNYALSTGKPAAGPTFQSYYEAHEKGRGIWKWNNALAAYQRHFGKLVGKPMSVAEVGVQSGGSLLMWKNVLGSQIKLHGLDINPACEQFKEANVTITIGDQGDVNMWNGFFTKVPTGLDVLVDDGGHEAHQMLTTLKAAFPHIHPGGHIAIEDITNEHYLQPFFLPTAAYLAQQAQNGLIDSVHLYPMLLVVRKAGFAADSPLAAESTLEFSKNIQKVTDLTTMWTAISTVAPGTQILLQNPTWTNYFLVDSLTNFFTQFIGLTAGAFQDTPKGCSLTAAVVCTNEIKPTSHLQQRVSGVHIYKDKVVVEVPAAPPRIMAVRRGDKFINYAGPA